MMNKKYYNKNQVSNNISVAHLLAVKLTTVLKKHSQHQLEGQRSLD